MKQVGKVLIKDILTDTYLLMRRANHPRFGDDPDLPGGTLEEGEAVLTTAVREVYEEAGIKLAEVNLKNIYHGDEYSTHGTVYDLFYAEVPSQPEVIISWEHSGFEWVTSEALINVCHRANDTYMHMVGDAFESFKKTKQS